MKSTLVAGWEAARPSFRVASTVPEPVWPPGSGLWLGLLGPSRPFKSAPRANPHVILKCSCHAFLNHHPRTSVPCLLRAASTFVHSLGKSATYPIKYVSSAMPHSHVSVQLRFSERGHQVEATRDMRQSSAGLVADPLCSASLPHPHSSVLLPPCSLSHTTRAIPLRSFERLRPVELPRTHSLSQPVSSPASRPHQAPQGAVCDCQPDGCGSSTLPFGSSCLSITAVSTDSICAEGRVSRPFKGAPRANPQVILKCSCHVFHNHRPHTHCPWSRVLWLWPSSPSSSRRCSHGGLHRDSSAEVGEKIKANNKLLENSHEHARRTQGACLR